MQIGQLVTVRSSALQFPAGAAQNAGVNVNIAPVPQNIVGPVTIASFTGYVDGSLAGGGNCRARLKAICVQASEARIWEVFLWGTDQFSASASDPFVSYPWGNYLFPAVGTQIGAAGLFRSFASGLDIPYQDLDQTGEVHVTLINRSANATSAATQLILYFEPTLGW